MSCTPPKSKRTNRQRNQPPNHARRPATTKNAAEQPATPRHDVKKGKKPPSRGRYAHSNPINQPKQKHSSAQNNISPKRSSLEASAPITGPHLKVTSPEYQINNRWIEAKFLGSLSNARYFFMVEIKNSSSTAICSTTARRTSSIHQATSPQHQIDNRFITSKLLGSSEITQPHHHL